MWENYAFAPSSANEVGFLFYFVAGTHPSHTCVLPFAGEAEKPSTWGLTP